MEDCGGLRRPSPLPATTESKPETPVISTSDRRLYVGNLATEVTEYTMIKLFEPYGTISKLDFLFHKEGPMRGKPRGYCFVEYRTPQEAQKAMEKLRGRKLCGRQLAISWSKPSTRDPTKGGRPGAPYETISRGASVALMRTKKMANASVDAKIKALERKLAQLKDPTQTPSRPASSSRAPRACTSPTGARIHRRNE
ncbi:hypothetical protein THASP1DRAFT_31784 [Thamnocephalis sphaerospora]|uniref:Probable RNA-binding protein 18 n=1 Tax=Thamnocephalis sphaerospora TaxID=78915 RepID=A0A4V1IW57_9FUNG|nr:hypothetical protein THASP1DRAFT_31784 [Thamnocephalis sphaerospora]|eukprot:RKP06399.1 hypothetical protein THASP1DRAFT_31784 [Thamnocephalis sphaerospora]